MAQWVRTSGGNIPDYAVRGGYEPDGKALFVARAHHNGEWIPGKAAYHLPGCHIPHGGQEIIKNDYEVLVHHPRAPGLLDWQKCSGGQCPANAFCCQPTHALYPARAHHQGGLHPGKLHTSHHCCYISYGGKEIPITNYEVVYCAK